MKIIKMSRINVILNYQNSLHKRIKEFINLDNLTISSKLFFPMIDTTKNDLTHLLKEIKTINKEYNNILRYSYVIVKSNKNKNLSSKKYSKIISLLIQEFYEQIITLNLSKTKKIINKKDIINYYDWKNRTNDKEFLKPIFKIEEKSKDLSKWVDGIYLQGSMSTLDYYKGFSDLDTLIIIKEKTTWKWKKIISLRKEVAKLRSKFYTLDSAQHHGFSIILEQEMKNYPQNYFPINLFKHCIAITNRKKELKFDVLDDFDERKKIFLKFTEYFNKVKNNKIKIKNKYQWKLFLSKLLLLPTLYLQAKGHHIHKKKSFNTAKKEFTDYWEPIDLATEIRKNWKEENKLLKKILKVMAKLGNPHLPSLITYLQPIKLDKQKKKLIIASDSLATKMEKKLRKEK